MHVSAGQIAMYMPLLASWLDKVFLSWADSLREAAACFSSLPYTCCHNAFPARVLHLDALVPVPLRPFAGGSVIPAVKTSAP